eukprot:GHVR01142252.1.p1 GENE.GHVR01142252.1~~GHVR01142252.1.p1  ORF type:complete len:223 (+),score=96.32 GHVR01142252.1:303-971(+)
MNRWSPEEQCELLKSWLENDGDFKEIKQSLNSKRTISALQARFYQVTSTHRTAIQSWITDAKERDESVGIFDTSDQFKHLVHYVACTAALTKGMTTEAAIHQFLDSHDTLDITDAETYNDTDTHTEIEKNIINDENNDENNNINIIENTPNKIENINNINIININNKTPLNTEKTNLYLKSELINKPDTDTDTHTHTHTHTHTFNNKIKKEINHRCAVKYSK